MQQQHPTGILVLKRGRDKPIKQFHPWIFSGAIARMEGEPEPGDVVDIVDSANNWLARAFYNPHSQIRARVLTWQPGQNIDEEFWTGLIQHALTLRQALSLEPETNACRLIHAESDGLPGLIVDQYGDILIMQCLIAGMERIKTPLADILSRITSATGIMERSDADVRQKEGLSKSVQILAGTVPDQPVQFRENDFQFQADLWEGHKTGFYLDQRDNRRIVCQPSLVEGKSVLNLFSYTGGFAVYAAGSGAASITNVDTSRPALELAESNIQLNGWDRPMDEYILGDCFEVLRAYRVEGRQFDLVILDPPKFAHRRADIEGACRGYKDLNWLALQLLREGGYLATFSCSGLVERDLFQKVLFGAALDAGRQVQIVQQMSQGADHPVSIFFPEGAYLKGFLCRVL